MRTNPAANSGTLCTKLQGIVVLVVVHFNRTLSIIQFITKKRSPINHTNKRTKKFSCRRQAAQK